MSARVKVAPELLIWAGERSGRERETLLNAFSRLPEWEAGSAQPTFAQLEDYARKTYTPIGYFFLPEPPEISLPIPDLRTVGSKRLGEPSPDLLDTIAICMDRQDWYRSYLIERGEGPLPFVGSLSTSMGVHEAANTIREALDFGVDARARVGTWEEALRALISSLESAGILVMASGVVGSNSHRKLDPGEFRGFALADSHAPVIFVNSADARSAQAFTLAHELVHIWLGLSAVTDWNIVSEAPANGRSSDSLEYWVNDVAAELLVPEDLISGNYQPAADLLSEVHRLSRFFKVSNVVVLRRLADLQLISWRDYRAGMEDLESRAREAHSDGGNFYRTVPVRASPRFTRAVVTSTLEGRTLYRDAFRLLGFSSQKAFDGLSHELGIG